MTNSTTKDDDDKQSMADHVADTHRSKPIVGNVVTGDMVRGEVSKKDDGDSTEA